MFTFRRTSRRRASAWMKAILAILVVILVAVLGLYALGVSATHRWQRYADSLRARGQPVTFLEIDPLRATVPEELNGARVLEKLATELSDVRIRHRDSKLDPFVWIFGSAPQPTPDFFKGLPSFRIDPSRRFVEQHRESLDALTALRDLPTGRYDIAYDPTIPIDTHMPSLSFVHNAAKLERLATTICLVDADIDGAVAHTRIQFRIAATLHDEPILISRLVQIAIESQAVDAIEGILRVREVDDKALETLHALITERIGGDTMKWALLGERALFVDNGEAILQGRLPKVAVGVSAGSLMNYTPWPTIFIRVNLLQGAEMFTWLVDAADDPKALLQAAQRIETEVPKLPFTQELTKIMMPSLTRAMALHVKSTARLACARAAIAAERFRLKTGRLPESIDELVPEQLDAVPTDPFDGQPMRFKTTDDGIVIYSVDENLTDDGGDLVETHDNKGKRLRPRDVGFRLHRPDRRGLIILDVPPPAED